MRSYLERALCGLAVLVLVSCAGEPSLHLEGFRSSLRKLDASYGEQASSQRTLLDSRAVEGMERAPRDLTSWRYIAFQSEMYRGMSKGDKPRWYRKAAKEEVADMQHAPQDLRQFIIKRTNEATRQREQDQR